MNNINNVKDPYGLIQKAGKRKTRRNKRTLRKKHKKTRRHYRK